MNPKSDNYKWWLLFFLWVAFFLHQGTRQIYNAILPQIQGDFKVDSFSMGLVGTVFTMTYGFCAMPSGLASDMLRRKWMVISGLAIFCSGIFLSGCAWSIGLMIVFYGLLNGAGQAFYYPAACSLLGQLHDNTRATALAIHQTALYAGIIICSCVSGFFGDIPSFGEVSGWRVPFLASAVLVLVYCEAVRKAVAVAGLKGPVDEIFHGVYLLLDLGTVRLPATGCAGFGRLPTGARQAGVRRAF